MALRSQALTKLTPTRLPGTPRSDPNRLALPGTRIFTTSPGRGEDCEVTGVVGPLSNWLPWSLVLLLIANPYGVVMTGDLDTLRSVVSSGGQVCGPDDRGYAEAVRIWNEAIERRPSVVVRCSTAADVAA